MNLAKFNKMIKTIKTKIGLALGSGSAKGLAHIGVIKVLQENNIPIDFIAGSSIGAMIGGFYAAGLDIKEIEKIALSTDWQRVFSVLFDPYLKQGLISGEKIKKFIENYISGKTFEDCKIPLAIVATDLKTGEPVVLNKGKLSQAIRASISIPLIFKPAEINERILMDGGLSLPVPVEVVKNMGADIVIAVNLDNYEYDKKSKFNWYNIANDSLNILRHHLALLNVSKADIVIDINMGKNYWFQFTNCYDKILTGEKAAKKILPKLEEIIKQKIKTK